MTRFIIIFACLFACLSSETADGKILLPHSKNDPHAIQYDYFPSRLHAFVFRNWTSVSADRLAKTIGAKKVQIEEIAAEMGLPKQGKILPEWDSARGYITVVRRNWHLLDYPQLLTLLNLDAETFQHRLNEDDFLFQKLGSLKPVCGKLEYAPSTEDVLAKAKKFAQTMRDAKVERLSDECEKFSFIKDFAKAENSEGKKCADDGSIRIAFSYFSDYGDPLMTDLSYPEGLLERLAKNGANGIWLHVVLNTLVEPDGIFKGSKQAPKRIENLNKLISRAEKFGIKVWLYFNEPRCLPSEFFESSPERAALRGTTEPHLQVGSLCTSKEPVKQWLSKSVEKVFSQAPKLGGVFTITASENLTNCLSHYYFGAGSCPLCTKRGSAEVISEVNNIISRAVKRASPNAKTIVWDWGWREPDDKKIIELLDKDIIFMTVSEIGAPITRGAIKGKINEYSLSQPGPSERARKRWEYAEKFGHKTMAKVQANLSWEFAATPSLPVLRLVGEHARNLKQAGVKNFLLSWSLGGFPSENMELFTGYDTSKSLQSNMMRVAEKYYGKAAAKKITDIWNEFSDAFAEYPYHIGTLYNAPHNVGAANPIYAKKTGYKATMVGLPYDDLKRWRSIYPAEVYIGQMRKVAAGFFSGIKNLKSVDDSAMTPEQKLNFAHMKDWADIAAIHFQSAANQAEYVALRDGEISAADGKNSERISEILKSEKDLANRALEIVLRDPFVGYESSNHYFYTAIDLFEKIASIECALKK